MLGTPVRQPLLTRPTAGAAAGAAAATAAMAANPLQRIGWQGSGGSTDRGDTADAQSSDYLDDDDDFDDDVSETSEERKRRKADNVYPLHPSPTLCLFEASSTMRLACAAICAHPGFEATTQVHPPLQKNEMLGSSARSTSNVFCYPTFLFPARVSSMSLTNALDMCPFLSPSPWGWG